MGGHRLPGVIDGDFLTVELDGQALADIYVRDGVVHVPDLDGGVFVHGVFHALEAADLARAWLEGTELFRDFLLLAHDGLVLSIELVADPVQPRLRLFYRCKAHVYGKGSLADMPHAVLHMPFLPAGSGIAEPELEAVEGAHPHKRVGRLPFRLPHELLYRHFHVVVQHDQRGAFHIREVVAVALHERQRVLMAEQVRLAVIAVWKGEHGHVETAELAINVKLDFPPVELADMTRGISDPDEGVLMLGGARQLPVYVAGNGRVAHLVSFIDKYAMDGDPVGALLPKAYRLLVKIVLQDAIDDLRHLRRDCRGMTP